MMAERQIHHNWPRTPILPPMGSMLHRRGRLGLSYCGCVYTGRRRGRQIRGYLDNPFVGNGWQPTPNQLQRPYSARQSTKLNAALFLTCVCGQPLEVVADNLSTLHDKLDALELGDIVRRIAGHTDEIRIFAFLDRSNPVSPAKIICAD